MVHLQLVNKFQGCTRMSFIININTNHNNKKYNTGKNTEGKNK